MKFVIDQDVFQSIPDLCVGVVIAKGVDNHKDCPDIAELLDAAMLMAQQKYAGKKVKEDGDIIPYREAFRACGINPNKYPCSIEALFSRIAKGSNVPHINALVDLNNAISLKTTLPMGTHDLGDMVKLQRQPPMFFSPLMAL